MPPKYERVLLHLDVDAFYAQVEEIRNPSLRDRPVAITQKYLCVTTNYHARRQGVGKLMSVQDAKACCPSLVLVSGEDLTPYRHASRAVLSVLSRFGIVEKGGMDEAFVDVSKEAAARVTAGDAQTYHGHVLTGKVPYFDLLFLNKCAWAFGSYAVAARDDLVLEQNASSGSAAEAGSSAPVTEASAELEEERDGLLRAGSAIAAEARAAIKTETGLRTSAGISSNKMLAKLVSGLHKPNDQTVLLPTAAQAFMGQLPLRAIPGIGHKMNKQLDSMGLSTITDLRGMHRTQLTESFGERLAAFMYDAARGQDESPIKPPQPSKTVTVEDSFKSCASPAAAAHVMKVLAPDLLARLREEHEEYGRRPTKFLLKWRLHGGSGKEGHSNSRASASCSMPPQVSPPFSGPLQAAAIEKAAMTLLTRNTTPPLNLTLLNLGATKFVSGGSGPNIAASFARAPSQSAQPAASQSPIKSSSKAAAAAATVARRDYGAAPKGQALSKQQERAAAEGYATETTAAASATTATSATCAEPQKSVARSEVLHALITTDTDQLKRNIDQGDGTMHCQLEEDEWGDIMHSQRESRGPPMATMTTAAVTNSPDTAGAQSVHSDDAMPASVSAPSDPVPETVRNDVHRDNSEPVSAQLASDMELAKRLQQEERNREVQSRKRNRDAFLNMNSSKIAVSADRKKQQTGGTPKMQTLHHFFRA